MEGCAFGFTLAMEAPRFYLVGLELVLTQFGFSLIFGSFGRSLSRCSPLLCRANWGKHDQRIAQVACRRVVEHGVAIVRDALMPQPHTQIHSAHVAL